MKVALLTGGQPRFTPDFIKVLNQLQGFDSADIYMCLWKSDWAYTDDQARVKIEKVLPSRYNEFPGIVPESDPVWETVSHGSWSLEHLMGTYFKKYQRPYRLGTFNHFINTQGRSAFTDKHYHHGVVPDPTA